MNNRPQNYSVKTRLQKAKDDETAQSETPVNNSDLVPQPSTSAPQVIEEVDNHQQSTAAEDSEATESASETSTSSAVHQHLQQPTETENIALSTPEPEDNIIDEDLEIQPIMAAGLNLPKYTGAESPVIWISKLEA